jgi:hypothetical protein
MMIHLFVRVIHLLLLLSADSDLVEPVHPPRGFIGGLPIYPDHPLQSFDLPSHQRILGHPALFDLERQHDYHRTACLWRRYGDPHNCRRPRYQYYGGVYHGLHQHQKTADRPAPCLDAEGLGIRGYPLLSFLIHTNRSFNSSPSSSQSV